MFTSMRPGRKILGSRRCLAIFLAAVGVYGLGAGIVLAGLPGDGGPLLGYSWRRAALLAAAFLPSLGLLGLAVHTWRSGSARVEKVQAWLTRPGLQWAAGLTALLALTILLPAYTFGPYAAYYERLRPLLAWLGLAGLQTWIAGRLHNGLSFAGLRAELRGQGHLWRAAGGFALAGLLLWALARFTSLAGPDDRFWHEAGVPVLGLQVLLSLALAGLLGRLMDQAGTRAWPQALLLAGLWGLAVFLWAREPLARTYFTPGPYPPGMQVYPFSDAAYYDTGGQYILLGKGIDNTYQVDKPLYMLFLGLLHALAGQDYGRVMFLQVLVLAFQPVILYLLGRDLHSHRAGLLAALLLIFQERNAIAAGELIQLAHVRLMLTETLAALLLLWLGLLLWRWWAQKTSRWPLALLAGCVLGSLLLVRPNPLVLLPFILLAAFFAFRGGLLRRLLPGAVFLLGTLLTILPWTVVSAQHTGQVYLLDKINLVLQARYRDTEAEPTLQPAPTPVKPDAAQLPTALRAAAGPGWFIPAHFIHNEWMSALILPHTFSLHDLAHTLQAPYWRSVRSWDGSLPAGSGVLMLVNLGLLSLGVGHAWRRGRLAGLAPLLLHLGYHLANALGRTSGARYLVPVDWAVLLYYALGLAQLMAWARLAIGRPVEPAAAARPARTSCRWPLTGVAGLMLLGALIPLAGALFPEQYPAKTPAQAAADLQSRLPDSPWTDEALTAFIQSGGSVLEGRALYPRFYGADQGEPQLSVTRAFNARPYPRLIFTLLGAERKWVTLLPVQAVPGLPDAADGVVLGCWNPADETLDAAAVVVFDENGAQIFRSDPARPLTCPLQPPACNDNRECR